MKQFIILLIGFLILLSMPTKAAEAAKERPPTLILAKEQIEFVKILFDVQKASKYLHFNFEIRIYSRQVENYNRILFNEFDFAYNKLLTKKSNENLIYSNYSKNFDKRIIFCNAQNQWHLKKKVANLI